MCIEKAEIRHLTCTAGSHAEAVRDYTAVLALAGESDDGSARVDAHYVRGVANEKLGDLRAAIADFTEVLRLEPTHVKAILARGACYNLASDYEAACGARHASVQREPDHVMLSSSQCRCRPSWLVQSASN